MRSIFGKCIAMAMMAAIAIAWQSPPVQATVASDVSAARRSARSDAGDATRAAKDAKKAAEDATEAAEDAQAAADAARTAANAVGDADSSSADIRTAEEAADNAEEAAREAWERAGAEKVDAEANPPVAVTDVSTTASPDAWGEYKTALTSAGTERYIATVEGIPAYATDGNEVGSVVGIGTTTEDATDGSLIPYKDATSGEETHRG